MSGTQLSANGVSVEVRSGWEVEFNELHARPGDPPRSLIHLANFALPVERGDYGSGAVEIMDRGSIFMCVMEFDPARAHSDIFGGTGATRAFDPADFSPFALQRRLPGQSGAQRFFRAGTRAFGLYVVLGSGRLSSVLVPEVNKTFDRIAIAT